MNIVEDQQTVRPSLGDKNTTDQSLTKMKQLPAIHIEKQANTIPIWNFGYHA